MATRAGNGPWGQVSGKVFTTKATTLHLCSA